MQRYILRRVLTLIPVLWGVTTLVFLILHLIPGDPAALMLGETATPGDIARLRDSLGLNVPFWKQYGLFYVHLVEFNFGRSFHSGLSVFSTVIERFPATLLLTTAGVSIAVIIGLPFGIFAALKKYSLIDNLSMVISLIGVSMPVFWLGPLLIILFSVQLRIFPVSGSGTWQHLVLPAVTLGFALAAIIARMTRASMIEVLDQDYIRTARAKGLPERVVILKHALRNALIPIVTIVGLQFGALLGGAIITEIVFAWPGIGRLLILAIQRRDYPVVQGCVLVIAFSYILINFLTDVIYAYLDPRIRYDSQ